MEISSLSPKIKPKILTFVGFYLPGYKAGGPLRTIANMVEQLSDEFEFWIVTRDRDLLDVVPYPTVPFNQWCKVGNAQVYYCTAEIISLTGFARIICDTPHDVLYLNSFFDPSFTLKPLLARYLGKLPLRPLVLAPRGEFSVGALKLKEKKKYLFIFTARFFGLYKGITWQASSGHESEDIIRVFKINPELIRISPNLPALIGCQGSEVKIIGAVDSSCLRVVFLSRISPKKNLDYALKVLACVKSKVQFDIYGPVEDTGYWKACQVLADETPENIRVTYGGSIPSSEVANVFSGYDLFFFPTHGENYGHVIAESLTVGTPVLISDQTPWRDLVDDRLGWDVSLKKMETFTEIIEFCSHMTQEEKNELRNHIKNQIVERLTKPEVLEANRQLFKSALLQ